MIIKHVANNVRFALLLLMLLSGIKLMAQNAVVTGIVKDEFGEMLPGATITEKGTRNGVVTDLNGNFTIQVTGEKPLVISFMGLKTQEISLNGRSFIEIILENDSRLIDDVVVIGYTTVNRRDLTGSVSSITGKALDDIPVSSAATALAGRLAGVHVASSEGGPDSEISIRVRGGTSITQDNSPLYIVDGMIVNTINDIPMSDIATIDILKDASSTAIYGSQAANGVILITTKTGEKGKTRISFNSYLGARWTRSFNELLNPYEFVYLQAELLNGGTTSGYEGRYGFWKDVDIYKSVKGEDWQKALFGETGFQQNYNLSVSGGNDNTTYRVSLTRNDEDYVMINSGYVRNNVDLKIDSRFRHNILLGFNIRLADETIKGSSVSDSSFPVLRNAVKYAPTQGLQSTDDSDDDLIEGVSSDQLLLNPIQSVSNHHRKQNKFSNTYNLTLKWELLEGLTYNGAFSYTYNKRKIENVWLPGTNAVKTQGNRPAAEITNYDGGSYRITNNVFYKFKMPKHHKLDILLGQEVNSSYQDQTTLYASWFPYSFSVEEVLGGMEHADQTKPVKTVLGEPTRIVSVFGRANYSLKNRYLFTLTMRADATSVFAPGKRWGSFPGGAFAWRMSEEEFIKTYDWIDALKLRLSYGVVGNARVGNYWRQDFSSGTSSAFYPNDEYASITVPANRLRNDNLTWETTYSTNAGLDFSFLKGRVSGTIDIYRNITKDLLLDAALPSPTGYLTQYQNIAQTSNKGLEFSLTGYIIDRKDFSLSANFNIAFNKNRVDKYSDGDNKWKTYKSGWLGSASPEDFLVEEGQPLGQMYGYITEGIYGFDDFTFDKEHNTWVLNEGVPDCSSLLGYGDFFGPGALKLKKLSDDGTNSVNPDSDRTVIGNALPKHTGGFGLNATYKGFDASIFFNWSYGNDIYNADKLNHTDSQGSRRNQNMFSIMGMENRFSTIDPTTGSNIFNGVNADPDLLREINKGKSMWNPRNTITVFHSWAVEDGSFLRLNNVTLGYTLPTVLMRKAGIERLRFYVSGYNLHCWTRYSGPDPEVNTRRSTPLTPGVDYSAYPKSISFVGGVNLTF